MGTSLEQTPLPADQSQTTSRAPDSVAEGSDASPEPDLEGDIPISKNAAPAATASQSAGSTSAMLRDACRQSAASGRRECDAIVGAAFDRGSACVRRAPYCASDLQSAYAVARAAQNGGRGAIVGIVDAYGYPEAASDLAVYRKSMALPGCGTSNGCLRIVNQSGRSRNLPKRNADVGEDWRAEQALDLDVVSAICPNCKIVLVQANTNKSSDLAAGVNAAVAQGAIAVVNSYSGKEENAGDGAYRHPGHAIVAATGNSGAGARGPCSYATVVCVGGTTLLPSGSPRGWDERAWHQSGSGCSAVVAKPSWQRIKSCKTRAVVDVSAVADPKTGVAVYESPVGWQSMGGTSVASALVGALFALGSNSARAAAPQWIWKHGAGSVYYHVAPTGGYDAQTGWGTPDGTAGF